MKKTLNILDRYLKIYTEQDAGTSPAIPPSFTPPGGAAPTAPADATAPAPVPVTASDEEPEKEVRTLEPESFVYMVQQIKRALVAGRDLSEDDYEYLNSPKFDKDKITSENADKKLKELLSIMSKVDDLPDVD